MPETLGAVKRAVDRDRNRTPGRFLITGSVRAAHQAATWPGTGRLSRVRMYGLTQAEIERYGDYNRVDAFFHADMPPCGASSLTRADYIERIVAGRFPAVLGLEGRDRSRWCSAYVEQLVDRDAGQLLVKEPRPSLVRAALNSRAARTAQELNKSATAADADMDYRTAERMLGLLEDLSIILSARDCRR